MTHFLKGVNYVVQSTALRYLSYKNAEVRAMGEPIVDMHILRKYTENDSGHPSTLIDQFWEVLTEMDEEDKRNYLKFVNSRSKLTTNPGEGRRHKISYGHGGDARLPLSHTCFFQIDLPKYSTKEIMRERILTAIRFCGEIDTD